MGVFEGVSGSSFVAPIMHELVADAVEVIQSSTDMNNAHAHFLYPTAAALFPPISYDLKFERSLLQTNIGQLALMEIKIRD